MRPDTARDWPWFLPPSRRIGGFTVQSVLRSAGKTITLKVIEPSGRPFAMKIPVGENATEPAWAARFEREVQILRRLSGPSFPQLRAFGFYEAPDQRQIPYVVTSLPIGPTLREQLGQRWARKARPDVSGAPHLLRALAMTLCELHEQGVVHRNIRPDKIAISSCAVQLLDFVLGLSPASESITRSSDFLGTPDYIAPEQFRSPHDVDARADLYALGHVLYEYVTYERPFGPVHSRVDAALKHLTEDPIRPSEINPDVPQDLEQIILRLLSRERGERFQSASALLTTLDELFQSRRAAQLSHLCLLPPTGIIEGYRVCEALLTTSHTVLLRVEDARGRSFAMRVPARYAADDTALAASFSREVELLRQSSGPRYLQLCASGRYAAGEHKALPYIVTQMPLGPSLRDWLDERVTAQLPPDIAGAPALSRKLGALLSELHERGLSVYALRPENVAVAQGEVQLLDFALSNLNPDVAFTNNGVITPVIRHAPEQLGDASEQHERAAQYQLGVLLYEYTTHQLPTGAPTTRAEALLQALTAEVVPPNVLSPSISDRLANLILQLLAVSPADRFPTMGALLAEIAALPDDSPASSSADARAARSPERHAALTAHLTKATDVGRK